MMKMEYRETLKNGQPIILIVMEKPWTLNLIIL